MAILTLMGFENKQSKSLLKNNSLSEWQAIGITIKYFQAYLFLKINRKAHLIKNK
jgi:hypothetical protein